MRALVIDDHPLIQEAVANVLRRLEPESPSTPRETVNAALRSRARVRSPISCCSTSICRAYPESAL